MKKITLGFSILAISATLFTGCNKKTNPEPTADKEFQSSVDVSYANSLVTEIDMICGFLGENAFPKFFVHAPGSNTLQPVQITTLATVPKLVVESVITWPANTKCMDGKIRTGSIAVTFTAGDINTSYYRDYKYQAKVTFNNYHVDGWKIYDTISSFYITNTNPTAINSGPYPTLSWNIKGALKMVSDSLPVKTMLWDGELNKKIANLSSLSPAPSPSTAISWTNAVVSYDGSFKGYTPGEVAYTYSINPEKPLIRNFTCSPDKVLGVSTTPTVSVLNSEFHPFIDGVASFTTASLYPRSINYGADDYLISSAPCDNSGSVTIKGISYKIDFKK